mgnify:CR=1 FL=1
MECPLEAKPFTRWVVDAFGPDRLVWGSGTPAIVACALAFGFMHIIFHNALAVALTLIGGVLTDTNVNAYLVDAIIGLSVVYKAFENMGGFKSVVPIPIDTRIAVFAFGAVVFLVPPARAVLVAVNDVVIAVLDAGRAGVVFVFGPLAMSPGETTAAGERSIGFVLAAQVLPAVIFFASLMGVLYHLGFMQKVVQGMAWVMFKALRISGAESLSVAANVFVGQTEAPLVVRPYIARMTQSELLTMMVGGMATIAGGVLAAYITMLGGGDEAQRIFYAKHLLAASVMAAPATIVLAKILQPETEAHTQGGDKPLQLCPLQSDGISRQNNSDGRDSVAGDPYERAAGTGIHGKAIEQGNFQQARSEEN